MTRFPFVAWFLDRSMPSSEQDREWAACFYVIARSAESAKVWGDAVANAYCSQRTGVELLRSYMDTQGGGWSEAMPSVTDDEMPTDEQLGL